jgi:predicted nucleotide-binding protein (sugar kinase/HSP70/actin superfamily)
MAQKTENLSKETLDKLTEKQVKINNSVFNIGQAELRIIKLEKEIEQIKLMKTQFESDYDKIDSEFNEYIKELEKVYPNGEIDLQAGTVTFQSAE